MILNLLPSRAIDSFGQAKSSASILGITLIPGLCMLVWRIRFGQGQITFTHLLQQ